jgi:hypothetical protein
MTAIRHILLPDGAAWAANEEVVIARGPRRQAFPLSAFALAPGDGGQVVALGVDRRLWHLGPRQRPWCWEDFADAFDAKPGLLVRALDRRVELHSPRAATAVAFPQPVRAVAGLPLPGAMVALVATRAETWLLTWSDLDGGLRSTPLGLPDVVDVALLPGPVPLALLCESAGAGQRRHVCAVGQDAWQGVRLHPLPALLAEPRAPLGLRPGPAAVAGSGRWFTWSGGQWRPTAEPVPADAQLTLGTEPWRLEPRSAPDARGIPPAPSQRASHGRISRQRERLETTRPPS